MSKLLKAKIYFLILVIVLFIVFFFQNNVLVDVSFLFFNVLQISLVGLIFFVSIFSFLLGVGFILIFQRDKKQKGTAIPSDKLESYVD